MADFCLIDFTALRSREFGGRIPLPGFEDVAPPSVVPPPERSSVDAFVCRHSQNGVECGASFSQGPAFFSCAEAAHNARNLYFVTTPASTSISCRQTFVAQNSAGTHRSRAPKRGHSIDPVLQNVDTVSMKQPAHYCHLISPSHYITCAVNMKE
eukprot:7362169-Pyramimonas_sp.AAC.1